MALIGILEERYAGHEIERAVLEAAGHRILDIAPDEGEWTDWLADAEALLVNLSRIGEAELEQLPKLRAISRYGVGCDAIDVDAASRRGIAVIVQPEVTVAEVSEHTMALWLSCMRQIIPRDAAVRRGEWNVTTPAPTRRIQDSVFGIVGFGHTGQAVARKVQAFDVESILVHDPYVAEEEIHQTGCISADFDHLLSDCGTISLHLPLNEDTRGMIGAEAIARMRRGSCLINTARGGLVDMDAVVDALQSGHLHSVGFDVFPEEPPQLPDLMSQPGAVFTDHIAWYSVRSQVELQRAAAEAVAAFLEGDRSMSVVNADALDAR